MFNFFSPSKEIVEDCINSLLGHLNTTSVKSLSYIVDALSCMAQNSKRLAYLNEQVIQGIIEKMVGALTEVTTEETSSIGIIHFYNSRCSCYNRYKAVLLLARVDYDCTASSD